MDEFLYSKEYPSILDAIHAIQSLNKVNMAPLHLIEIQMKIFLPGTFESPVSVIQSNTVVKQMDSAKHPKCLYNMNYIQHVTIHGDGLHIPSQNRYFIKGNQSILCINHYRYGSFEYVYGIKEGRGGGVHREKYKHHMILNSSDSNIDSSYIADTFLKDHSDIWCQHVHPCVHLYPKSSWLFLKENLPDKYDEFCLMNDDKFLSVKQIHEISIFFQSVFKKI